MTAGPMKVKRDEENRKKLLGDRKKKDGPDDETQVKEIFCKPWRHACDFARFRQGLVRENRSLRDSAAALDEVLEQAGSIFGNLVGLPEEKTREVCLGLGPSCLFVRGEPEQGSEECAAEAPGRGEQHWGTQPPARVLLIVAEHSAATMLDTGVAEPCERN